MPSPEEILSNAAFLQKRDKLQRSIMQSRIATSDPDKLEEYEARAMMDLWAKSTTFGTNGTTELTADQYTGHDNKVSWRHKLKRLQNNLKTAEHRDAFTGFDKTREMSKDELTKASWDASGFFTKHFEFRKEQTPFGKIPVPQLVLKPEDMHESERERMRQEHIAKEFGQDFMKARQSIENRLSEEAKEVALAAVEKGGFTSDLRNMVAMLPPEERGPVVRYAEALRKYDPSGPVWEIGDRVVRGIVGVPVGLMEFMIESQERAVKGAQAFIADDASYRDAYKDLEQLKKVHAHRALFDDSFKPKWHKDGIVSKSGLGTVSDSIGYMLYASPAGPAALLRGSALVASMAHENTRMFTREGMDQDEARVVGFVVAAAQVYTERLVDLPDFFPKGGKAAVVTTMRRAALQRLTRAGLAGGKVFGGEMVEEILQGWQEEIGRQVLKREFDPKKLQQVTDETIDVMKKAGAWFALLPSIKAAAYSRNAGITPGDLDVEFEGISNLLTKIEEASPNPNDTQAFTNRVLNEWMEAADDAQKIGVLQRVGVENAADVHTTLSERLSVEKQGVATPEPKTLSEDVKTALTEKAAEWGYELEMMPIVVDKDGRQVNALYSNGKILLSMAALDKGFELDHEIFHGIVDSGGVTAEEMAWFNRQAKALIQETGVNVDYADLNEVAQLEEALADKWADSQQARSIVRKVGNVLRRITNLVRGLGFKTSDDIFDAIAKRQVEGRKTRGSSTEKASRMRKTELSDDIKAKMEAEDVEYNGPQPDFIDPNNVLFEMFTDNKTGSTFVVDKSFSNFDEKLKSIRAPFEGKASRIRNASPRLEALRATMALMASGQGVNPAMVKALHPEADYDAADIIREAREELDSIKEYNLDQASMFAHFTEAAKRRENNRQLVEAVRLGREGQRIADEAKKREADKTKQVAERKRKERKLARVISDDAMRDMQMPVPDAKAIADGIDVDTLKANVLEAATRVAEKSGLEGDKVAIANMYAHTMAHIVNKWVRHMEYGRARSRMQSLTRRLTKDGTKLETADKLVDQAFAYIDKVEHHKSLKTLEKSIDSLLSAKEGKRGSRVTLGKDLSVSKAHADELRLAKKVWKLDASVVNSAIKRIGDLLTRGEGLGIDELAEMVAEVNAIMPIKAMSNLGDLQKLQLAHSILSRYGAVKSMGKDAMAQMAVELEATLAEGKQGVVAKFEEQTKLHKEAGELLHSATRSADGKTMKLKASWHMSVRQRLEGFALLGTKQAKAAMQSFLGLMGFQQASDDYQTRKRANGDTIAGMLKNAYNKSVPAALRMLTETKAEFSKYNLETNEPISKSQLMQRIAAWQQDYRSNMENVGYTQELIDQMRNELTAGDLSFMNEAYELYREQGDELNEVGERLFDEPLANADAFFAPVLVDTDQIWTARDHYAAPLVPPSYNRRVPNTAEMSFDHGFLEMLDSRLAENAHFLAYAETSALARSVFGSGDIARQMRKTYGDDAWRELKDHLTDIYGGGRNDAFKSKTLRTLSSMVHLRAISGNVKILATQLTSWAAYGLRLNVFDTLKFAAASRLNPEGFAASYVDAFKAIWNSEQFANRVGSGPTEFVRNAMVQRFGGKDGFDAIPEGGFRDAAKIVRDAIKTAYKLGMFTNTVGDAGPIITLGPVIYMSELAKTGNADLAMSNTWSVIHETQQSFATQNRSRWSRRGGVLGKLMAMFTTTPGQFLAFQQAASDAFKAEMVKHDGPFMSKVKAAMQSKAGGNLAKVVFINHILLPGMFYTVSQAFSNAMTGDEWDEEELAGLLIAMAMGPFAALPIMAGVTQDFLSAAVTGKGAFGRGLLPADSILRDATNAGKMIHELLTLDLDEALEEAIKFAANLSAPSRHAKQLLED